MNLTKTSIILIIIITASFCNFINAEPIDTIFTYEGYFWDGNLPADGIYDLKLTLYNHPEPNIDIPIGYINEVNDCYVEDGSFSINVDFSVGDPNVFNGQKRWVEIGYRDGELKDPNEYTIVKPRQEILAVPYALFAASGTPGPQGPAGDSHWELSGSNTYYKDGNVGIGTENPHAQLDVEGIARLGTPDENKSKVLTLQSKWDNVIAFERCGDGTPDWQMGLDNTDGSFLIQEGSNGFGTVDDVAISVETNGNVGIGTTSPSHKLEVVSSSYSNPTVYGLNDQHSDQAEGVRGSSNYGIGVRGLSTYGIGVRGTSTSGGYAGWFEGMSYFSSRVGIGTSRPECALHVVGNIAYTGSIFDISDVRLKENIAPLDNALGKILSINSIYFNNKGEPEDNREVGVIAQEVEKVLPEVVLEDSDGYKSVDYSKLTTLLIEAVKEQQSQIDKLKAENNVLKDRLEALEKKAN